MAIVQSDGALVSSSPSLIQGRWSSGFGGAGAVTWFSGRTMDYATIYRTQPNVRLVVNFLARNIAQLGIKPFERLSDSERRSLGDSDLGRLLRVPNLATKTTRYRFIHALISDLGIFDAAYFLKTRNRADNKLRLWRLPPQFMEPLGSNLWMAEQWRFLGLSSNPVFGADDLVVLRGYNPDDARLGLSPIESLKQILSESQAASDYREQFWKGGARISGVIERSETAPKWSPEAKDRFLAEWNASFTGNASSAGGTSLLEDGMTYRDVSFSAKDSEYITARKLTREEVAAQYHVSPLFVGILENANFSNVKEQHRHLYQDTLGPTLKMLEEEFHLQLLGEFPELDFDRTYIEFDLTDKLRGSFEEESTAQQTSVGGPWRTRNEARARDNLPPVEGGDELITPLNVLIGGQASPTDAAPPGTASFPYFVALDQLGKAALPAPAKALRKASEDLPDDVQSWYEEHKSLFEGFFGRQGDSVVAALAAGSSLESIFGQSSRWNDELREDLFDIAQRMSADLGQAAADEFSGEFDPERMDEYLEENARIAAENVNETTKQQLAALDDLTDRDATGGIFATAVAARAAQIAISRATAVGNFARKEGAFQGGATKKRWNVRSLNSRHPRLDGEEVDIEAEFSNGARWPGDHQLNEDQRAGCTCSMSFV